MNPFSFKEKGFSFVFFQIDINLDRFFFLKVLSLHEKCAK